MPSLDQQRHAAQSALLAAGGDIVFGSAGWPRLPDDLRAACEDVTSPAWLEGGLTARVRRVERAGGAVALKKARPRALVSNRDGELSFVNELLCRERLHALTARGAWRASVTPTLHASLHDGVIVSPWIDGGTVARWDQRTIAQLLACGAQLLLAGFFEWDYCDGNVLDDGTSVWLFDFGYTYPFDPRRHLNTAGNGTDCPQFHLAERFETRNFFAHLMEEEASGIAAALALFRLEKEIAVETYERLARELAARHASTMVLDHYAAIVRDWRRALAGGLDGLYLREGWRSHAADVDDDLHGQSCTPATLRRVQWLIDRVADDHAALRASGALDANLPAMSREALLEHLHAQREKARRFQLAPRDHIVLASKPVAP